MEKDYQYDLTSEQIKGREVVFTTGLGQANVHDPNQPREFDAVLSRLFPALKSAGMMNYGEGSKFDDRKYRLNTPKIRDHHNEWYTASSLLARDFRELIDKYSPGSQIVVPLGLTNFAASVADINRSDVGNHKLQELGYTADGDEWAFFSRAIGAAFVPVTKDGSVFVGKRVNTDLYPGYLNAAAGGVDYVGEPSLDQFKEQAIRELRGEYGQRIELIEAPRFVGIASHLLKGDADAVWVGRIDAPAEYFTSGRWREERKDAEHAPELVQIATLTDRDQLLQKTWFDSTSFPGVREHFSGIMYSTRLGLESLTGEDFRKE